MRRTELNKKITILDKELTEARTEGKALDEQADKMRDEIAARQSHARDLATKIQLYEAAIAVSAAADPARVLLQPSSYDLLSLPIERLRLLEAIR